MGLFMALTTVAPLLSPSIGGYLYSASPLYTFCLAALLSVVALLAITRVTKERRQDVSQNSQLLQASCVRTG